MTTRTAKRLAVKEWRAEALRLSAQGWTFLQIGQRLGKAPSTVHEAIARELAAIPVPKAEELRAVKTTQLDAIIRGSLPAAEKGNANAAFVVIAAIDKQVRLHGLAVAEKLDITTKLTLSFDAHEELLRRFTKLIEAKADGDAELQPPAPPCWAKGVCGEAKAH